MIDTLRIRTGFDLELQIGAGWFFTAVSALHEKGLLLPDPLPPPAPPGSEAVITGVEIIFEPGFDLRVDVTVAGFPFNIRAALELSEDGSELRFVTDFENVEFTVPFDVFDDLAAPPVLRKLLGEGDIAPSIALMANMDIRAGEQSAEPLPGGEHVERGDPTLARSFLPAGQDLVLGLGKATFDRLANNIWHTQLRNEDDGSHPLPDEENKQGEWSVVTMTPRNGGVRLKLEGDIPVDSPFIDLVPDPHVTVTLDLTPVLQDGDLAFEIEVDSNVDTGVLGDIFAFLAGGLVGFIIGLFTGGAFLASALGLASVITLEIVEHCASGQVTREVRAKLDGEEIAPILTCREGVVQEASARPDEDSFSPGPLDAIPRSVPVFDDEPDPLFRRTLLVTADYDEHEVNADGFALAGKASAEERFQPKEAVLTGRAYEGNRLVALRYRRPDGVQAEIPLEEVLERMESAELQAPFAVAQEPAEADFRLPEGRLPSVCLHAEAIRRKNTVVTDIQFGAGVDLKVADAVRLQDAGALIVRGLQLIHPKNANPYYRSFADSSLENNFENLPTF